MTIDYPKLNAELLHQCPGILQEWYPQGRTVGHEFKVGSTSGEAGKSLSVNINTGVWKDFATDEAGDLIELYAKYTGLKNKEAADQLIKKYSIREAVEDVVVMPISRGLTREAPLLDASVV